MSTLTDMLVVFIGLLTAITVVARVGSSEVVPLSAESDEENTIRQALFLVKLLKAEHMKYLRENDELVTSDADDANSTCPEEEFNSTTPSLYTVPVPASTPPVMLSSQPNLVAPPSHAAPSALPVHIAPQVPEVAGPTTNTYSPPHMVQGMPAEYILPPADNYNNYPSSGHFIPGMNQRRMMPANDDYDDLMPRFGGYRRADYDSQRIGRRMDYGANYRRFGYIDQPPLLREQALYKGYRRVADSGKENADTGGTGVSDALPKMSETIGIGVTGARDGASKISETVGTAISVSTKTVSLSPKAPESTTAKSSLVSSVSKKVKAKPSPSIPMTLNQRTVRQKSANALQALGKASKAEVWKDAKLVRKNNIARQRTTTEAPSAEDRAASVVAAELLSEIKGTKADTGNVGQGAENDDLTYSETPTFTRSTMKIFLAGSSRMQIPFSENNAFCHLYPHNKLCGSVM